MSDKPVTEMNFEQTMVELEAVVSKLESSQVALDDSIKLYERGAELKKHCEEKLKAAEEKVAQITLSPDGKVEGLKPVEG